MVAGQHNMGEGAKFWIDRYGTEEEVDRWERSTKTPANKGKRRKKNVQGE